MKQLITPAYTYTPGVSGVGTVNLSGISSFNAKRLSAIINITRGTVIYAAGISDKRYTNVSGTTLTLFVDTSTHNAADLLQVIYDDGAAISISGAGLAEEATMQDILVELRQKLEPADIAGLATAAAQATGNSSLSSMDGKLPALVGGKIPVDIGTPTLSISGNSTEAKQDTQITAANLTNTKLDSVITQTDNEKNSGAVTAKTQRVVAASNSPDVAALESINTKIPSLVEGRQPVESSNLSNKFREAFETYNPISGGRWTQQLASGDIIALDGNAAAASYLVISKDPTTANGESRIETVPVWEMPFEVAAGIHMSQRTVGQEFSFEAVSTETPLTAPTDLAIATIQQATTTLTVTTSTAHGLRVGMRIGIRDCVDPRMNYASLVVATTPSPTQFTATAGPQGAIPSVTAGPFTSGFVYFRASMGLSPNGTSMIFENATATNASFYVRSESGDALPGGVINANHSTTILSTASVQAVNAPLNYAFQPTNEFRLKQFIGGIQWSDIVIDSLAAENNRYKRTQVVPDFQAQYRLRIRAVNQPSFVRPIAKIVSAAKTGTTTVTVVTDVAHNLTTSDLIQAYGTRDQTNFPNLAAATAVASIVSPTSFTVVWGAAVTATTFGGEVNKVNGGQLLQGLVTNGNVQSIARTSNIVSVVTLAAVTGLLIGDYINVHGARSAVDGSDLGLDGAYRVRDQQTTTLFLEPIGSTPTGSDVVSTNCGGVLFRRTDMRISFIRALDFERQRVEILPRPQGDISEAASVNVQNIPAVTVNSGTVTTVSTVTAVTTVATVSAVTAANLSLPGTIADVASAALTTTTTTATLTPTFGTAYQVNIPVTVVSGTNPTLDVNIEESTDNGTGWVLVYSFPRITATGLYNSPILRLRGTRVRYAQTVTGTTPSFTRAINRSQISHAASQIVQLIDRTIVPNTLNSTTPTFLVEGCQDFNFMVRCTAQTTAATLTLQFSHDGTNWHTTANTLTTVVGIAHGKVQNEQWKFARLIVSAAGTGITLAEAMLVGNGK